MTGAFTTRFRIRFAHCDPAGIAYYPRYFELCDAAIEEWSEAILCISRSTMHHDLGLVMPTVDLKAVFSVPSRLGDWLDIRISVTGVGRSSVALSAEIQCDGQGRFTVQYTQVLMDVAKARAMLWPDDWRGRLMKAMTVG